MRGVFHKETPEVNDRPRIEIVNHEFIAFKPGHYFHNTVFNYKHTLYLHLVPENRLVWFIKAQLQVVKEFTEDNGGTVLEVVYFVHHCPYKSFLGIFVLVDKNLLML